MEGRTQEACIEGYRKGNNGKGNSIGVVWYEPQNIYSNFVEKRQLITYFGNVFYTCEEVLE